MPKKNNGLEVPEGATISVTGISEKKNDRSVHVNKKTGLSPQHMFELEQMTDLNWPIEIRATKDIKKGEKIKINASIPIKKLELDYLKSLWENKRLRRSGAGRYIDLSKI